MTERSSIIHLPGLRMGCNKEPRTYEQRLLTKRPSWATCLVYGTRMGDLLWAATPITERVELDIQIEGALGVRNFNINYGRDAGWRNVWIQPPVVEAPARLAVFYACTVEDVDTPYGTLEEAKASAERHAKANPGTRVTVMQEHGVVVAATKLDWS